jgi:GMP synthase-like glutamine amidotransferase
MKMILVLNFFLSDAFARSFDRVVKKHLAGSGHDPYFIRVRPDTTAQQVLENTSGATHLILSGSEASTLDDLGWEEEMKQVVGTFINTGKPVLGICYGHQFLVRCLAGKEYLRKAPRPEMGWADLLLEPNPLFEDINHPICLLSHYDEAVDLPPDFKVLGQSEKCAVHAFQYRHLPVWGVQFHPEYDLEAGEEIFDDLEANDPLFTDHFASDLDDAERLKQNKRFFTNFVNQ